MDMKKFLKEKWEQLRQLDLKKKLHLTQQQMLLVAVGAGMLVLLVILSCFLFTDGNVDPTKPTEPGITTTAPETTQPTTVPPTTTSGETTAPETTDGTTAPTTEPPVQTTVPPVTTQPPVTVAPTTVPPTTAAPTTVPPTTAAPTTAAPTTVPPTTAAPTTVPPTTVPPTTHPTTGKPTTPPTTVPPTTVPPTTVPPTTVPPTTVPPTTVPPTTVPPTTVPPTTVPPTTVPPTTQKPTVDPNGTFKIVENGESKAYIVIAKDYTDKTLAAAADLQKYLKKITGVTVKVIYDTADYGQDWYYILVGPSKYTEKLGVQQPTGYPENEKFMVKRIENYLILMGNDDGAFTGTEFAVTRFLEELGCGWFGTRELWQVVPSLDTISIEQMDIEETPKFISRENRVFQNFPEVAKRWYMGGVHGMYGEHFLSVLIGAGYFEEHPEWYARDSKGEMYKESRIYWQYCYSNEGLIDEVAKRIIQKFDEDPTLYIYSLTPNDGWTFKTCTCDKCNMFPTDSDVIVYFANEVGKRVAKVYPDRRLSFLAYHKTLTPPQNYMKLEPNVEIMYCAETTMTKPIQEASYIGMANSKKNIAWSKNFVEYEGKIASTNISVWKWLCIAAESAQWEDIPWVQGNVAIEDQNYWKSLGADYVFYDQGPSNAYREYEMSFALRWPLWYVANKGCWVTDATGEELLADACQKLFGKGADVMLEYYMALAAASEECTADSHAWAAPAASSVYTQAHIQKIDAIIARAKTMLNQVSDLERKRMENQIELWETAKKSI